MAHYIWNASTALEIGGDDCWNAFLSDQQCEEKQRLEESICSLTPQRDTYMQEILKAFASLTKVGDALSSLNLYGTLPSNTYGEGDIEEE